MESVSGGTALMVSGGCSGGENCENVGSNHHNNAQNIRGARLPAGSISLAGELKTGMPPVGDFSNKLVVDCAVSPRSPSEDINDPSVGSATVSVGGGIDGATNPNRNRNVEAPPRAPPPQKKLTVPVQFNFSSDAREEHRRAAAKRRAERATECRPSRGREWAATVRVGGPGIRRSLSHSGIGRGSFQESEMVVNGGAGAADVQIGVAGGNEIGAGTGSEGAEGSDSSGAGQRARVGRNDCSRHETMRRFMQPTRSSCAGGSLSVDSNLGGKVACGQDDIRMNWAVHSNRTSNSNSGRKPHGTHDSGTVVAVGLAAGAAGRSQSVDGRFGRSGSRLTLPASSSGFARGPGAPPAGPPRGRAGLDDLKRRGERSGCGGALRSEKSVADACTAFGGVNYRGPPPPLPFEEEAGQDVLTADNRSSVAAARESFGRSGVVQSAPGSRGTAGGGCSRLAEPQPFTFLTEIRAHERRAVAGQAHRGAESNPPRPASDYCGRPISDQRRGGGFAAPRGPPVVPKKQLTEPIGPTLRTSTRMEKRMQRAAADREFDFQFEMMRHHRRFSGTASSTRPLTPVESLADPGFAGSNDDGPAVSREFSLVQASLEIKASEDADETNLKSRDFNQFATGMLPQQRNLWDDESFMMKGESE